MSKYILGIDPGYRNLGICFMDVTTSMGSMTNIDLARWNDNLVHKIRDKDFPSLFLDAFAQYDKIMQQTKIVCIERVPGIGARKIRMIGVILETLFMAKYPHIELFVTSPVSVKDYFGTVVGDYDTRKSSSMDVGIFSTFDSMKVREAFTKADTPKGKPKFRVDGVEAAMMCLYIRDNLEKERKLKSQTPRNPGFKRLTINAKLNRPTNTGEAREASKAVRKAVTKVVTKKKPAVKKTKTTKDTKSTVAKKTTRKRKLEGDEETKAPRKRATKSKTDE